MNSVADRYRRLSAAMTKTISAVPDGEDAREQDKLLPYLGRDTGT